MTILPGRDGTTHLIDQIRSIWDLARSSAVRSVNSAHLIANWLTGRQIVEFEQGRVERAAYGHEVLKGLSGALISDFGKGFSISALKYMRAFYTGYPGLLPIGHAMPVTNWRYRTLLRLAMRRVTFSSALRLRQARTWRPGEIHPDLSWRHYRTLLKVERRDARDFLRDRKHQARLVGTKRHSSPTCRTSYSNLVAALSLSAGRCASPWTGDHFYPDLVFYHLCVPSAKRN
jgi:hypothetical protein